MAKRLQQHYCVYHQLNSLVIMHHSCILHPSMILQHLLHKTAGILLPESEYNHYQHKKKKEQETHNDYNTDGSVFTDMNIENKGADIMIMDVDVGSARFSCGDRSLQERSKVQSRARVPKQRSRVQFSDMSSLTIVPARSERDNQASWYSSDERRAFRSRVASDSHRMRTFISHAGPAAVSHEEVIIQCVGLENFLAPEMTRMVLKNRQRHTAAVLQEQEKQRSLGIHKEAAAQDILRDISEACSLWATERASEFGSRYFRMSVSRLDGNRK